MTSSPLIALEEILQVLSNACQSSCSAVATEQCWSVNRRSQIGASAVRLGGTKYQPTKGLDNNDDDGTMTRRMEIIRSMEQ